jgi:hypothetical protein
LAQVVCMNYDINKQMCPCPETECSNWAICCLCVANHRGNPRWPLTACQRGVKRPAATLALQGRREPPCPNQASNLASCLCTYEECTKRGMCCECIRNHWTEDGKGRVACFRN